MPHSPEPAAGALPTTAPPLEGVGVRLRALTEDDVQRITELATDSQSVRWTTIPDPYPAEGARDFVAASRAAWKRGEGSLTWAIEDPAGLFAGQIDLRPAPARWEIGYALHPQARGRGLLSAALRTVSAWGFEHGAQTLSLYVARGNWASRRVAWACGFTVDATLPGWLPGRGTDGPLDAWAATLRPGGPMTPAHRWIVPPDLAADGLRLRQWRDDDRVTEEPDHPAHFMPPHAAPTPDGLPAWLLRRREFSADGRSCDWCIADADSDAPIGSIGVFTRDGVIDDQAELGYQLLPSARGRGLATRAARLAVEHVLAPEADGGLGLRRLAATSAADNRASNAVLAALGFSLCGREHAVDELASGGYGDVLHWELLRHR